MNYDVFTMYYSDKISMKHPFSHVITGPSDQHPILKLRNINGFICKYLKIGFFGKYKSECQFWKSVMSKSKQTTKFRICRFRIGCYVWWNSYKKNDHAIPVLLIPGRYLNPSKKNQKKRKKRTLSTYFPPNPYFLPDIPCFYFEDRRKKKNDWSLQNNLIIVLRLWQTYARNK